MVREVYEKYVKSIKFQINVSSKTGFCGIIVIEKSRSAQAPKEISIWLREERRHKKNEQRS